MGYVINMPKLEMGMNQGTLLEWHVTAGESITAEDVLAEIESEKTVPEITAREDGVLREIYVKEGKTVAPGTSLGIVAAADEDIETLRREAGRGSQEITDTEPISADETGPAQSDGITSEPGGRKDQLRATPRARRLASERDINVRRIEGSGPDGAVVAADIPAREDATSAVEPTVGAKSTDDLGRESGREARATPRARRRARELGIDLDMVDGSGPKGAVTVVDIESRGKSATKTTTDADVAPLPSSGSGEEPVPVETRELSGMRRTIADRLSQSYREAVHVTVSRVVDAEELLQATEIADSYLEPRVSMMDLFLLAVSETLREHPAFNACFEDGTIELYERQDVGIAVDVERGLVTPVLRDLGSKPLEDIVAERRALTDRAVAGDATMADMSGGTFTVSNLGGFGVDSFNPVIDPPQVAILGVTRLRNRPVEAPGGDIEFRRHVGFNLSFDHRIVDGADAARMLDTLAGHVREPWPLLLDRT